MPIPRWTTSGPLFSALIAGSGLVVVAVHRDVGSDCAARLQTRHVPLSGVFAALIVGAATTALLARRERTARAAALAGTGIAVVALLALVVTLGLVLTDGADQTCWTM